MEAPATLIPGFDEGVLARLAEAASTEALKAKRRRAYDRYVELPAPTGFDEVWRRTDPGLFPFGSTAPLP